MKQLDSYGPIVARILLALIFVLSGVGKITGFEPTVGYIASKGVPFASLAAIAAILVELGGGLAIIIGWKSRIAAILLFGFTLIAAVIFHNFWAAPAAEMQNQMIHFLKNIAIAGGLLLVVVHGSGARSLE